MGKTNTGVGWWKLLVPLITIVLLLALFLHPSNFTTPSLLPYGVAPMFFALPTTGIVFAYLGFRQGLEYGGEAKNPQRDVPLGTVIGFLIVVAIYVLLQTAFIGGVDWSKLLVNVTTGSSWKLVPAKPGQWGNLTSALVNIAGYPSLSSGPFYEVLRMSAIPILVGWGIFLLIDAIVSPSGTGWIYEGTTTRTFYGMAADGHLPDWFLWLNRYKIPWVSLVASLVIGALFLIPYPAWVYIISFVSSTTVYTYMIGGPAVLVLRRTAPQAPRPFRLPAAWVIGGPGLHSRVPHSLLEHVRCALGRRGADTRRPTAVLHVHVAQQVRLQQVPRSSDRDSILVRPRAHDIFLPLPGRGPGRVYYDQ